MYVLTEIVRLAYYIQKFLLQLIRIIINEIL